MPTKSVLVTNKAVHTAALVANGWAGAENLKKQLCDGPTDRWMDRQTEKWLIEMRVRDYKRVGIRGRGARENKAV